MSPTPRRSDCGENDDSSFQNQSVLCNKDVVAAVLMFYWRIKRICFCRIFFVLVHHFGQQICSVAFTHHI